MTKQTSLFGTEDLPLFSQTAPRGRQETFNPPAAVQRPSLFGCAVCHGTGRLKVDRKHTRYCTCPVGLEAWEKDHPFPQDREARLVSREASPDYNCADAQFAGVYGENGWIIYTVEGGQYRSYADGYTNAGEGANYVAAKKAMIYLSETYGLHRHGFVSYDPDLVEELIGDTNV